MYIDVYTIVTSPYRTYLQVPTYEMSYFDYDNPDIAYENMSYVLIYDSPLNRAHLESKLGDKGVHIRFKHEYWPELENSNWQLSNNIRPHIPA